MILKKHEISAPTSMKRGRTKHQNDENYDNNHSLIFSNNIMFDSRVIRGNTYASPVTTEEQRRSREFFEQNRQARHDREEERRRRRKMLPPLDSRETVEIQTDHDWEDLPEYLPNEATIETQTEPYEEEKKFPIFCPHPLKFQESSTQVETGELFDFDLEIQPITQALVYKVLERATNELAEEEEIRVLKRRKDQFLSIKHKELEEIRELEEYAKIKYEEKERRVKQALEYRHAQLLLKERVEAQLLATTSILEDAKDNAINIIFESVTEVAKQTVDKIIISPVEKKEQEGSENNDNCVDNKTNATIIDPTADAHAETT